MKGNITKTLNQSGFTLIELAIVIALLAILTTLGFTSFTNLLHQNKLTTQTNDFINTLNYTRSEAIKRGHRVTACKSGNGASCQAGVNWEDGWIVFTDPNNPGIVNASDGEVVLRVNQGMDDPAYLLRTPAAAPVANRVSFNTEGFPLGTFGTFTLCRDRDSDESAVQGEKGEGSRQIVISRLGRIRVDKVAQGGVVDCTP